MRLPKVSPIRHVTSSVSPPQHATFLSRSDQRRTYFNRSDSSVRPLRILHSFGYLDHRPTLLIWPSRPLALRLLRPRHLHCDSKLFSSVILHVVFASQEACYFMDRFRRSFQSVFIADSYFFHPFPHRSLRCHLRRRFANGITSSTNHSLISRSTSRLLAALRDSPKLFGSGDSPPRSLIRVPASHLLRPTCWGQPFDLLRRALRPYL
jgi:hypothetical protein